MRLTRAANDGTVDDTAGSMDTVRESEPQTSITELGHNEDKTYKTCNDNSHPLSPDPLFRNEVNTRTDASVEKQTTQRSNLRDWDSRRSEGRQIRKPESESAKTSFRNSAERQTKSSQSQLNEFSREYESSIGAGRDGMSTTLNKSSVRNEVPDLHFAQNSRRHDDPNYVKSNDNRNKSRANNSSSRASPALPESSNPSSSDDRLSSVSSVVDTTCDDQLVKAVKLNVNKFKSSIDVGRPARERKPDIELYMPKHRNSLAKETNDASQSVGKTFENGKEDDIRVRKINSRSEEQRGGSQPRQFQDRQASSTPPSSTEGSVTDQYTKRRSGNHREGLNANMQYFSDFPRKSEGPLNEVHQKNTTEQGSRTEGERSFVGRTNTKDRLTDEAGVNTRRTGPEEVSNVRSEESVQNSKKKESRAKKSEMNRTRDSQTTEGGTNEKAFKNDRRNENVFKKDDSANGKRSVNRRRQDDVARNTGTTRVEFVGMDVTEEELEWDDRADVGIGLVCADRMVRRDVEHDSDVGRGIRSAEEAGSGGTNSRLRSETRKLPRDIFNEDKDEVDNSAGIDFVDCNVEDWSDVDENSPGKFPKIH